MKKVSLILLALFSVSMIGLGGCSSEPKAAEGDAEVAKDSQQGTNTAQGAARGATVGKEGNQPTVAPVPEGN